jgi:hypothetical protein
MKVYINHKEIDVESSSKVTFEVRYFTPMQVLTVLGALLFFALKYSVVFW